MSTLFRYIVAFIACYASGLIGLIFIKPEDIAWYHTLSLPPLTPPDSVFPILWVILYALAALALGSFWARTHLFHQWVGIFFISLIFNAAWPMFFFGFHALFIALFVVTCLVVILIPLELGAYDAESPARYLLIPYLLWSLFALYLNAGIWLLR